MTTARQDAYHVITAANSAVGPGALVINNVGSLPLEWRFRALGCMAQEADFDTTAAAAIWGDSEARSREHLNVLVARALLKRQPNSRWQQHAILRAYALSLQDPAQIQELSLAHAFHYLMVVQTCYESKPRDYNCLEQEFRQIEHSFAWAQLHNPQIASKIVLLCDDFLRNRGRINILRPWLHASLKATDSLEDCIGKATTLRSLGDMECRLGNFDAARRHYEDALALYESKQAHLGTRKHHTSRRILPARA